MEDFRTKDIVQAFGKSNTEQMPNVTGAADVREYKISIMLPNLGQIHGHLP